MKFSVPLDNYLDTHKHIYPPKRPHVYIKHEGLRWQFINKSAKEGVLWDITHSKPVRVHCSPNTMLQVISTEKEETECQVFMTRLV